MLFVDPIFFVFFFTVLLVYWALPTNGARKWFLLGASYIFYGAWSWKFAGMLLILSIGDFYFGRQIGSAKSDKQKKYFVIASLAMNLSVLAYFKYSNFFVSSMISLLNSVGMDVGERSLNIILPVGISFFTFQSLSYIIDVYRNEIKPVRNIRDYLLCAAFFPQLVAGPIMRPKIFLPQLESKRSVTTQTLKAAVVLFIVGFIKKSSIADNISPFVDAVFLNPEQYSNTAVITASWLYAVQIYCDFSGYSDMAIAVASMMGYRLIINFNAPYIASSLQDFWRRWHISLSSWIRDYIYIPLGGRHENRFMTYRNLVYTMLAGGLWHGPSWTFVLWGGLHGAGQVVQQEYGHRVGRHGRSPGLFRKILFWFITLQFVVLCWILFRAPNFQTAWVMISKYLFIDRSGSEPLSAALFVLPLVLLAIQYWLSKFDISQRLSLVGNRVFFLGVGASWALILALLPLGHRPFIYFQF